MTWKRTLGLPYYTTSSDIRPTVALVLEAQMKACGIYLLRAHRDARWLFGRSLDT